MYKKSQNSLKSLIFKNEYSIFGFFIVNLVNVDCIIDDIFSNFMRIKDVEQQKMKKKVKFYFLNEVRNAMTKVFYFDLKKGVFTRDFS